MNRDITIENFLKRIKLAHNQRKYSDTIICDKFYPVWKAGEEYVEGNIVRHNENVFRVISDHTSVEGFDPDIATGIYHKMKLLGKS